MCHVLIIEDEPLIAFHIQSLLGDAGALSFAVAETEQKAIDAALDQRPDLITSDVQLIAGTGPDAVRTIVDSIGPIPVIFITGAIGDEMSCEAPHIVLGKPFKADALHHAFGRLWGQDRARL